MKGFYDRLIEYYRKIRKSNNEFYKEMDRPKYYSGLLTIILGIIIVISPLIYVILFNITFTTSYLSEAILGLGIGVYFLGLAIVWDSLPKRNSELSTLSKQIDNIQVILENYIQNPSEPEYNPQKFESEITDSTAEEIAGKTLAYQAFQTSCIIIIAFAAFIFTAMHYDGLTSLLAGCVLGISFGLIALCTIKELGFKLDPNLTKISAEKLIRLLILLVILIAAYYTLIHIPNVSSPVSGNITIIYENCNYSVSNVVNNYTVIINQIPVEKRDSIVSIKELKDLMQNRPTRP
jgi:hypothetical protein